jgi:hypothetical protein
MKDNDLTDGISGRVGNKLVFRTTKGVTIATRRPKPTETPVTAKQTALRENFKRAASYAKRKLLDPVAKEEYLQMAGDKAFRNSFSEALRDYLVFQLSHCFLSPIGAASKASGIRKASTRGTASWRISQHNWLTSLRMAFVLTPSI